MNAKVMAPYPIMARQLSKAALTSQRSQGTLPPIDFKSPRRSVPVNQTARLANVGSETLLANNNDPSRSSSKLLAQTNQTAPLSLTPAPNKNLPKIEPLSSRVSMEGRHDRTPKMTVNDKINMMGLDKPILAERQGKHILPATSKFANNNAINFPGESKKSSMQLGSPLLYPPPGEKSLTLQPPSTLTTKHKKKRARKRKSVQPSAQQFGSTALIEEARSAQNRSRAPSSTAFNDRHAETTARVSAIPQVSVKR